MHKDSRNKTFKRERTYFFTNRLKEEKPHQVVITNKHQTTSIEYNYKFQRGFFV